MKAKGLYHKFVVTRTDGQSDDGEKHAGCSYFVLDLDHDPATYAALRAYVAHTKRPALAGKLYAVVAAFEKLELCSDGAEKFRQLMEGDT